MLYNLLGTDSEEETPPPRARSESLPAVFCRQVANGVTKQTTQNKGDFYLEVKLYHASVVEKVAAEDRWRHALVSAKTRVQHEGPEWVLLQKLLIQIRELFSGVTATFIKK